MADPIVVAIVTFLHDLFTAIWIGGLILLGLVFLPSLQKVLGMGPEIQKVMNAVQNRLSKLIYVSIVGLILTGVLLSNRSPVFLGFFSFANPYSAALALKHVFVAVMVVVALFRSLVLGRKSGPLSQGQVKLNAGLLFLNIALGTVVLLLSGFLTAFS